MESMFYVAFNGDTIQYDVISSKTYHAVFSSSDKLLAEWKADKLNEKHHYGTKKLFKYHREITDTLSLYPADEAMAFSIYRLQAISKELEKRFVQLKIDI